MSEYVSIGRLEPEGLACLFLNHAHLIFWRGESVEMAQSIAKAFNKHDAEQRQTICKLQDQVEGLNNLMRNAGWGQGEIDSAAVVDDNIETLKQTIEAHDAIKTTLEIRIQELTSKNQAQAQRIDALEKQLSERP